MPELPEVETIARGLARAVTGDVIESIWLGSKPEPLKSTAAAISSAVVSTTISGVRRVGKHIVFNLDPAAGKTGRHRAGRTIASANALAAGRRLAAKSRAARLGLPAKPSQFVVHLGMTGRMLLCDSSQEIAKHTHAILALKSGRELRFVDPRRFGRLSVSREFAAAGAEPLEVELEKFISVFCGRKLPIKSALLNQRLLSGVGNIYADESLFRAAVRPRRRAALLTKEELRRLFLSLKEVLKEAIAAGGSSVSDYVNANGESGFFQFQHRVYGREGEPCLICKTPIRRIVIGGRSSHYCPKCQK